MRIRKESHTSLNSPQAAGSPFPLHSVSHTVQIASGNVGKIEEFRLGARLWLADSGSSWQLVVEPVAGLDALPSCEEDGETFPAHAQKKALPYSRLTGAPGVRSRRFAGQAATDAENNAKLLREMVRVVASKRTARFVCVIAVAQDGEVMAEFQGVAEGVILDSPRGAGGFGYDPLFLDPESNRTFAEISPEEKLQRSHRGRALRAMLNWLTEQPSGFSGRP